MSVYLIEKAKIKKCYYSFKRLLKEENIEDICSRHHEKLPTKENLPVSLIFGKIKIERVELDERV
jgi:hypothetical protein